ncbi:MAG: hypothetical protein O7D29_02945 [Gemmatimonadetes bacterium]|nr:hypothetical protein [Gemmatimonadota bacterium]
MRESLIQQRLNLIYDGNPPVQDLEDLDLLEEVLLLEEDRRGKARSFCDWPTGRFAVPRQFKFPVGRADTLREIESAAIDCHPGA